MAMREEVELRQLRQGSCGCSRVQVYADVLPVQALEALDLGRGWKRKLDGRGKRGGGRHASSVAACGVARIRGCADGRKDVTAMSASSALIL